MAENKAGSTLTITLVKSLIGRKASHVATANSMKLKKVGDKTVQPGNDATIGKINKISYLIKVEE